MNGSALEIHSFSFIFHKASSRKKNGLIIICSLLNHLSFDIMQDLEIHWSEIDRLKCQTPANEVDDRPKRRLAFYENRPKSMHSLIANDSLAARYLGAENLVADVFVP